MSILTDNSKNIIADSGIYVITNIKNNKNKHLQDTHIDIFAHNDVLLIVKKKMILNYCFIGEAI